MKLYIKQKVFSFADKFTIKDEWNNDRYYVEGEIFTFGKKLHVYDANHREVIFIKQRIWSFLSKYEIYINGHFVTEIIKELSFLKSRYVLSHLDWRIEGDVWGHNYSIQQANRTIVTINKAWFTWGDSYEVNVLNHSDEQLAIGVVLAIDCVLAQNNDHSNSISIG